MTLGMDEARVALRMRRQQYDADPPRCLTCVYFKRALVDDAPRPVRVKTRRGYRAVERKPTFPTKVNPMIEKCTFGNFATTGYAVCDEWHSKAGERIDAARDAGERLGDAGEGS